MRGGGLARRRARIEEEYALVQVLGKGAMAMVYRAKRKRRLDEEGRSSFAVDGASTPSPPTDMEEELVGEGKEEEFVALKVVDFAKWANAGEEELRKKRGMLEREIAILEALRVAGKPRLLRVHAVLEEPPHCGQRVAIVMEELRGHELFERILARSRFTEFDAALLLRKILNGLGDLHAMHIIHRDLKPENLVFVDDSPESDIKLTDFGLSVFVDPLTGLPLEPQMKIYGTAPYLAPEIITEKRYSYASDVWSIGCVLYILLCGYPPFYGSTNVELFNRIKSGALVFHESHWSDVSPEAKDLITKMLHPSFSERLTIAEVLRHPWMSVEDQDKIVSNAAMRRLKLFNAKRKLRLAVKLASMILPSPSSSSSSSSRETGGRLETSPMAAKENTNASSSNLTSNTATATCGGKIVFTTEQLQKLHDGFERFASEGERTIDYKGFQTVMRELGLDVHLPLHKVFKLFVAREASRGLSSSSSSSSSSSNNPRLSYREFLNDLSLLTREDEWIRFCFEVHDGDGDGYLNKAELGEVLRAVVSGNKSVEVSPSDVEEMFRHFDADGNGLIDLPELSAGVMAFDMLRNEVRAHKVLSRTGF